MILGTLFDDYQTIVVSAPSAYVTSGMKNGIFASVPSWMVKQQALTYVKFKFRFRTISSMLKNWMMKRPISYLSIWDDTLKNQEESEKSRIPVENIRIPVMFIAGEDDQLWPSSHYVKLMEKKLKSTETTQRNHYLYYKNAGHFLSFPYSFTNLPANVFMNIGGKMIMTFGGTKQGNAIAAKNSWRQILTFLEKNNKFDKM